ncbi:RING-type E3 ubiquitin transferase [Malassezia psittaci]|uniref:RING-type E3 ubiquitin transferase n=1 Tax=Malassezia psittaci TaxID=1821823 RepID=A0AAF0FBM6_9BASI|nr:RING-type E3 ubiquitin transferase [Malassezia psittaci]
MASKPRYHLHICEFQNGKSSGQLPLNLFDQKQLKLKAPNLSSISTPERPSGTDERFGTIQVHFLDKVQRKNTEKMKSSVNETYARFQPLDSFQVESAPDDCNHDEQHEVRIAFGVVHLFRLIEDDVADDAVRGQSAKLLNDSEDDPIGTILCILSVPSSITVSALLDFIDPALEAIQHIRIVRHIELEQNLVLLKFRDTIDAEEFYKMYNGRPFHALDPSEKCNLVYVTGVTVASSPSLPYNYPLVVRSEPWPVITNDEADKEPSLIPVLPDEASSPLRKAAYELPTCPVCLERLDSSVSGLITGVCQHVFHCSCLQRWSDSRCPVCRYTQSHVHTDGSDSTSHENAARTSSCGRCGTTTNLWVCLICANVGCGRYKSGHAREHFSETGHLYCLELETQRVWDYAGDGYVHRLIQSKSDGKLVELPSASTVTPAMPERVWNARYPGVAQARAALNDPHMPDSNLIRDSRGHLESADIQILEEKLHALGLEYSNMIMTQLDSQRMYYEHLLSVARSDSMRNAEKELTAQEQSQSKSIIDQLEARCEQQQNDLSASHKQIARYETQLRSALDSVRALKKERDEEKSVSDGLYKHIRELQGKQEVLQQQVSELTEELRDMMFYMSAQDKVKELDSATPSADSLQEGTAYVPDPPAKAPNRKGKGRRR